MPVQSVKNWVCIIQVNQGYCLLAGQSDDKLWRIHGFESGFEGIKYFQRSYRAAHSRGYEASMSACVNAIFFRPGILQLSIDDMKLLAGPKPRLESYSNVSGRIVGYPLDAKLAGPLWEAASKPSLISD